MAREREGVIEDLGIKGGDKILDFFLKGNGGVVFRMGTTASGGNF